jgi:hypothetical protein
MREIINILDEGVGLSNRKPGEVFKQTSTGKTLTFNGLVFYPESGRYDSEEELNQVVDSVEENTGKIQFTNAFNKGMGGFGLAHFTDDNNKDLYIGRWFRTISPNVAQNNFPHSAIPGGFQYQSPRATKENVGYKPSDILTQLSGNTPASIYQQVVDKFGVDSDIAIATKTFMSAKSLPVTVPKGDINFTGFRDYFCELLQPMALIKGMNVSGNASEAETIFFGAQGFNTCTASFHAGTAGGLYDSVLTNSQGKEIRISSKGASGAKASALNLLDKVNELRGTTKGAKLLKKYADVVSILEIIKDKGHFLAPLDLAVVYGMITPKDAQSVSALRGLGPNDKIVGSGILSKKMEKLYASRTPKDASKIIPIEHLTAVIAYMVADYVNLNTNFSQAASDILNHAAVIQVYTDAVESGDKIVIKGFSSVYPSQAVTGVELDATKVYYSTGGKGNYTFNILKNGAKPSAKSEPRVERTPSTPRNKR